MGRKRRRRQPRPPARGWPLRQQEASLRPHLPIRHHLDFELHACINHLLPGVGIFELGRQLGPLIEGILTKAVNLDEAETLRRVEGDDGARSDGWRPALVEARGRRQGQDAGGPRLPLLIQNNLDLNLKVDQHPLALSAASILQISRQDTEQKENVLCLAGAMDETVPLAAVEPHDPAYGATSPALWWWHSSYYDDLLGARLSVLNVKIEVDLEAFQAIGRHFLHLPRQSSTRKVDVA
mmetsp:Transcript_98133/g.218913  ORF Transcript_98133/g.218913 Transcript_98133/m.218913 type:complete len:238 (+) Transcript_98133:1898-2611(+)